MIIIINFNFYSNGLRQLLSLLLRPTKDMLFCSVRGRVCIVLDQPTENNDMSIAPHPHSSNLTKVFWTHMLFNCSGPDLTLCFTPDCFSTPLNPHPDFAQPEATARQSGAAKMYSSRRIFTEQISNSRPILHAHDEVKDGENWGVYGGHGNLHSVLSSFGGRSQAHTMTFDSLEISVGVWGSSRAARLEQHRAQESESHAFI